MYRPRLAALATMSVSALALTACLENPDTGTTKKALSGVGIDGYIAGATVYADLNDNNQLDDPEPRARTDNQGYFTYNPNKNGGDGKNYCDSGPQKYCLELSDAQSSATIRVVGGIDKATGTKFDGEIATDISNDGNAASPEPTSPLTALRDAVENNSDQKLKDLIANNNQIKADQIDSDFWKNGGTTDLIEYAVRAQKAVDFVASEFEDHYDLSDTDYYDLTSFVYAGLAKYWATAGGSLPKLLKGTAENNGWLDEAVNQLPSEVTDTKSSSPVDSDMATRVSAMAGAIDDAFNSANDGKENENKAGAKAATTVAKIAADKDSDASSLKTALENNADDIANEIKNAESNGSDEVDVESLAEDLAQEQKNGTLKSSVSSKVASNAVTVRFPEVAGTEFNARDEDSSTTKVFAAFMKGDSDNSGTFLAANSSDLTEDGELTVCRAKRDSTGLLEENPNRLTGEWERITDRQMVLDLGVGGVEKTANLRVTAGNSVFSGASSSSVSNAISNDKPEHIDWNYSATIDDEDFDGKLSDNFSTNDGTPPDSWKLFQPISANFSFPGTAEACRCYLDATFDKTYKRSGDDCSQFNY